MDIDFSLVKSLREKTGIGLVKCKEALLETGGNVEEAIVHLRKAGALAAAKRGDRATGQGFIGVAENKSALALVEVNCETDFVSKNAAFTSFANALAETVLANEISSLEALLNNKIVGSEQTVEEERSSLVQKTGENVHVRRSFYMNKPSIGSCGIYPHIANCAIGVVFLDKENLDQLAKDLAVHVVAFSPKFLSESDVPKENLEQEREIAKFQSKDKPEYVSEKIVEGKVRDYLAQVCLVYQKSLKEPKLSVQQWIKQESNGQEVSVVKFFCWRLLQD